MRNFIISTFMAASAGTALARVTADKPETPSRFQAEGSVSIDEQSKSIPGNGSGFEPFPLRHPVTGEEVSPDEIIPVRIPDKANPGELKDAQMTAWEYFKLTNEAEEKLSQEGHSLRDPEATVDESKPPAEQSGKVVSVVETPKEQLAADVDAVKKSAIPGTEELAEKLKDVKEYVKAEADAYRSAGEEKLRDVFQKAGVSPETAAKIKFAPLDKNILHKADPNLYTGLTKSWGADVGTRNLFGAEARASLSLLGDLGKLQGLVQSWASAFVAGAEINIILASADANLESKDGRTGGDASYVIAFLGHEYERWSTKDEEGGGEQTSSESQEDKYSKAFQKGYEYSYTIGPILMKSEIGAKGVAGVKFVAGYEDGEIEVAAVPYMDARGYANAAIDYELIAVGIQTDLVVIDEKLKIAAYAGQELDSETNTPFIRLGVRGTNEITLLKGYMYAFVKIPDPKSMSIKRYDKEIFDFAGIEAAKHVLFSFEKIIDRAGYRFAGSPQRSDAEEVKVEDQIRDELDHGVELAQSNQEGVVRARLAQLQVNMEKQNHETLAWLDSFAAEVQ